MPPKKTRTSRASRLAQVSGMAGEQAAKRLGTHTANRFRSDERAEAAIEARNLEMAERLVTVLGTMRGAAMKFGQMISMLDGGIIPANQREAFQAKLADLHANAPKVPWKKMKKQIETDLGEPVETAFAFFDSEPIAAASIGQVYRATLHDGREVAVKVQYPGIETAVRADLKNLGMFLKVYTRFVHDALDGRQLAKELEERVTEELDYVLEASNTRQVARAFRGHPFIRIPEVIDELSGRFVLTTEWLEGKPLSSAYGADLATRNRVAEILFRFYSGTPYRLRMYSGDPHPGNSLILADGSIGFVDFGLFKKISAEDAEAELETMRSAIEGDGERLTRVMRDRGFIPEGSKSDPAALLEVMEAAGWWYFRDAELTITSDEINRRTAELANPLTEHGRIAQQHNLPAEHAVRARAEAHLGAIIGQLSPTINLHRVAREWIYGDEPVTELGRLHRAWEDTVD
ncbi:MAG: ABC1 kinase family protein [Marmoricola sp.]